MFFSCLFASPVGSIFIESYPIISGAQDLDWRGYFTIILFLLVFLALMKEWFPPDFTMLTGAGALTITGIITPQEFLIGFSKPVIFILAMLFILARAMELNGLLNVLSKRMFARKDSLPMQLFKMMLPLSASSAFMNNTPMVLMLTPSVRRWALESKISPSKFLIPLSYATILGGACTLIGTSGNLVVDGMLRIENPHVSLGFFELGYVGLPCAIVGIIYMVTFGHRILPDREDTTSRVFRDTQDFTAEFLVTVNCVLANKTLREVGKKYFHGELLVEIERGQVTIDSPDPDERIRVGDRLVFAGDIADITELHAIDGLTSFADPHFKLDIASPHFSEAIISTSSSLIGKTLRKMDFRAMYGATVLTIYRQGKRLEGRVGDVILQAGDMLVILANSDNWNHSRMYSNDFYFLRYNEQLPLFSNWKAALSLSVLFTMIIAVLCGVNMLTMALFAVIACLGFRCISTREARRTIRWNLLVLIASAFALGHALEKTGVASFFASTLIPLVGGNPYTFVAGLFFMTLIITEAITNTAAALLVFPIAMQAAKLEGFESVSAMKAVAVTVAIASSCSFITPIGYQTNTIVYGPGGYRFLDYMRVGLPLSILIWILSTLLIPYFWPLT